MDNNTELLKRDLKKVTEAINLLFRDEVPNDYSVYNFREKKYNWLDLGNRRPHKVALDNHLGHYRTFWELRHALESALKAANGEPLYNQDRFNLDRDFLKLRGAPEYVMQHAKDGFEMEANMEGVVHTPNHKFRALLLDITPEQTYKFKIICYLYGRFELGYDRNIELTGEEIEAFTRI